MQTSPSLKNRGGATIDQQGITSRGDTSYHYENKMIRKIKGNQHVLNKHAFRRSILTK